MLCVSIRRTDKEESIRQSQPLGQWFTRGWTLQELLGPSIVEFFSQEWEKHDKKSLKSLIHKMTGNVWITLIDPGIAQRSHK
jgi:hypothetical protein